MKNTPAAFLKHFACGIWKFIDGLGVRIIFRCMLFVDLDGLASLMDSLILLIVSLYLFSCGIGSVFHRWIFCSHMVGIVSWCEFADDCASILDLYLRFS